MSPEPRLSLSGNRLLVTGDIKPDNVVAIRTEGEHLIAGQTRGLVIDLSGLGAAHSVVLSLLLCWLRLAGSRHQAIHLEDMGERLRSLAALSGLDNHLPEQSRS